VAGTKKNESLVGQVNGLTWLPRPKKNRKYHWPTVANAVLANTIRGLYPTISEDSLGAIDSMEESFASQQQAVVPGPVYERSVAHGQAVATAILNWAPTDGFSSFNICSDVPTPVPGAWKATPPSFNEKPLQPCWGMIRPMVLTSGEECPLPGHPAFDTHKNSDFYRAARQVYRVGRRLTNKQKTIATYWSDGPGATGTPPGHWIAIVSQIARNDSLSLAAAAEAYARVGIAVHDAFIQCWNMKYFYNLLRPVTYINDNIDASWGDAHRDALLPGLRLRALHTVRRGGARTYRHVRDQEVHGHDSPQPRPGAAPGPAHVRFLRCGGGRGGRLQALRRHPLLVRQRGRARFRAMHRSGHPRQGKLRRSPWR